MRLSPPPLPLYSQKIIVLLDNYDKPPVFSRKITGIFSAYIREFNQSYREYVWNISYISPGHARVHRIRCGGCLGKGCIMRMNKLEIPRQRLNIPWLLEFKKLTPFGSTELLTAHPPNIYSAL